MDDDDKKNLPAVKRTPEGTFVGSGNPSGRPRGARGVFSEQMIQDFARDWHEHGPSVLVAVRKENPVAYLTVAAKFVPREMLLQLARPLAEMADDELQAAALQEYKQATILLEHIRMHGGAEMIEQAQRDVLGEGEDDDEEDQAKDGDY